MLKKDAEYREGRLKVVKEKIQDFRAEMTELIAVNIRKALSEQCSSCSLDDEADMLRVVAVASQSALNTMFGKEP